MSLGPVAPPARTFRLCETGADVTDLAPPAAGGGWRRRRWPPSGCSVPPASAVPSAPSPTCRPAGAPAADSGWPRQFGRRRGAALGPGRGAGPRAAADGRARGGPAHRRRHARGDRSPTIGPTSPLCAAAIGPTSRQRRPDSVGERRGTDRGDDCARPSRRRHDAAAAASARLRGAAAVLLASIAACEAGHVELLT